MEQLKINAAESLAIAVNNLNQAIEVVARQTGTLSSIEPSLRDADARTAQVLKEVYSVRTVAIQPPPTVDQEPPQQEQSEAEAV